MVSTPRSVFDMLSKRHLRIDDLLTCICDEAARCCLVGSRIRSPHLQNVTSECSAPEILDLITKFMRDAVRIHVKKGGLFVAIEKGGESSTHSVTSTKH